MKSINNDTVSEGTPLKFKETEATKHQQALQVENPLIAAIECFILAQSTVVSEHDIIKHCDNEELFSKIFSDNDEAYLLNLFTKHFFVMNALYQLREQFYDDAIGFLHISATQINLVPLSNKTAAPKLSTSSQIQTEKNLSIGEREINERSINTQCESSALRDYYLDMNNLKGEDEQSINQLLSSFWKKYAHYVDADEGDKALSIFELHRPCTLKQLRIAYRRKIHKAHPDKGGKSQDFNDLQKAYDTAKRFLQH